MISAGAKKTLQDVLRVAEYEGNRMKVAVTQALAEGLRGLASRRASELTETQITAYEQILGEDKICGDYDLRRLLEAAAAIEVTAEELFDTLYIFKVSILG